MADIVEVAYYTGAITGIIGAITGIAGAVMGYISYRRTKDLKSLDLRLELKRAEEDFHLIVNELPMQLDEAKRSRKAILAATGQLNSGVAQKLETQWDKDFATANEIITNFPNYDSNYSSLSPLELEERLVSIHINIAHANKLKEKYEVELAKDNKERDRIRESHGSRV